MKTTSQQLISYIAPAAPATRRPAEGNEPYLRPEFGFTPRWFHEACGIDFGEQWHQNPAYRRESLVTMREELRRRFPGTRIGSIHQPDSPLDCLTGTFGACTIAGIFGIPIVYASDNWPNCKKQYLTDADVDRQQPPDLNDNSFFRELMAQLDWIEANEGRIEGFINWQGVLNNAQRLRGEALFIDMLEQPERAHHLFDCVCTTMIQAAKKLHQRQRVTGVDVRFFTISNCLVNMVSADIYTKLLLPYDQRIAREFNCIGIHNCAWTADPYLEAYSRVPNVAYIDMGIQSDLKRAKELFPNARRAIMYTPMDLAEKSLAQLEDDLRHIARDYGSCDIVAADIDAGTPDLRVLDFHRLCEEISREMAKG
ncbi:hypothetical protein JXJ21_12755 [candidate division KSB1 bacterium]|nr:hypothetical protein [candidate division KSB1 bacterium]